MRNTATIPAIRPTRFWLAYAVTFGCIAYGQIADSAPDVVANIPVNYTESKAGSYTLPDPLKLNNGKQVTDAKIWFQKRRPEIVKLIEDKGRQYQRQYAARIMRHCTPGNSA